MKSEKKTMEIFFFQKKKRKGTPSLLSAIAGVTVLRSEKMNAATIVCVTTTMCQHRVRQVDCSSHSLVRAAQAKKRSGRKFCLSKTVVFGVGRRGRGGRRGGGERAGCEAADTGKIVTF